MTARLTEKAVFVLGGILLLLPCIATEGSGTLDDCDDGGDAFLKPDCVTTTIEGQLFIGVIIVAVVLILAFILCCCCCYYHCCNKKAAKKHHGVAFTDPEEGNVEVVELKESKEAEEEQEEDNDKPVVGGGEEAGVINENITLSTFGHTKDEGKEESEEETEATKGEKNGSDETSKEAGNANQESKDMGKKVEEDTKEEASPEATPPQASDTGENKPAGNAAEAAELTQGQVKPVEGPSLQPVPVAPPIIFDLLTPALAKSKPPAASGTTTSASKEESTKEVTGAASSPQAEEASESVEKEEKKTEEPTYTKTASLDGNQKAVVMDFDDIDKALGRALEGLGDF
jgi:hypothetical protein